MQKSNLELVRRWFDQVWNNKRREAIAEMLAPDAVVTEGGRTSVGPQGFYPFFDRMQAAFSDITITIHDAIAQGDKVCVRWSAKMRHTGDSFGVPPTGKALETTGISIVQVAGGKLIAGWQNWDVLGLMQQIRSAPPRGAMYAAAAGR